MKIAQLVVAGIATTTIAVAAQADLVTFDLVWEGIDGSAATATGSVTIDTSHTLIADGGFEAILISSPASPFSDFTITIVNAADGNGTFTSDAGDISAAIWSSAGALDLGADLVGQANFTDFNLLGTGSAPDGVDFLTIRTDNATDDRLILTSMTARGMAIVPLPTAAWAGLAMLGAMGVRRRMRR